MEETLAVIRQVNEQLKDAVGDAIFRRVYAKMTQVILAYTIDSNSPLLY